MLRAGRSLAGERLRPPLGSEEEEEGSLPARVPVLGGPGGSAAPRAVPEALSRCRTLPPLLHAGPCSRGGMEERRS